jgi:hypothetical protein
MGMLDSVGTLGFLGTLGMLGALGAFGLSGCGSTAPPAGGQPTDADFAVCSMTPAVHYRPGMSVRSVSGAYVASIESAVTTLGDLSKISTAAIGSDDLTVMVTVAGDAGLDASAAAAADAGGNVPADLTMTSTALPWMPVHMHGASELPTVSTLGESTFGVVGVGFFMGGYWQLPLNLVPASGSADTVLFSICIPDD